MPQINSDTPSSFFSASGKKLYDTCVETIDSFQMKELIEKGVLVGLSGGSDSVFLTLFLLEYRRRTEGNFTILLVHINHGIRGDEADRDEMFCKKLASSLGLDIEVVNVSVPRIAEEEHLSIEEAARNARYSSFKEIIRGRNDISSVAVAHNMSDNAETVIFNILRGGGSRGASGIPPVRDNIFRPLLKISKQDIESALVDFGVPFVNDSTNLSTEYTRNYIRHEIIPRLSKVASNPEQMISRFSDNMRTEDSLITSLALEIIEEGNFAFSSKLSHANFSVYYRALSIMAERAGGSVSSKIATDIRNLLVKNNFSYSLINARFVCQRGVCRVTSIEDNFDDYCFDVDFGVNHYESLGIDISLSKDNFDKNFSNVYNFSINANLSSAIIDGSLFIRPKKDGDTIFYGGMTHKLKKLFNDRKIPLSDRKKLPVLCDNKGVVWVPGFGVRDDNLSKKDREDLFIVLGCDFDFGYLNNR